MDRGDRRTRGTARAVVAVTATALLGLAGNVVTNRVDLPGERWLLVVLGAFLLLLVVVATVEVRSRSDGSAVAPTATAEGSAGRRTSDGCTCEAPLQELQVRTVPHQPGPWPLRALAELESRRYSISDNRVRKVFGVSGWEGTLRRLYPEIPLVSLGGCTFPIWAEVAAPELRGDLDSAIGNITDHVRPDRRRYDAEGRGFDHRGRAEFRRTYWRRDEVRRFNAETFALDNIERHGPGRFRIHARYGTYFQSVGTSEMLEREFIDVVSRRPNAVWSLSDFPRRAWLRERADGNELFNGTHRAAALSVAAVMIVKEKQGYSALLSRRSGDLKTHPGFQHVFPSGILAPTSSRYGSERAEYSVKRAFLREFAEELFGYDDLDYDSRDLRDPLGGIWPIQHLLNATQPAPMGEPPAVEIRYTGISVPLLTLRPEVYVLVLVRQPGWFDELVSGAELRCRRHGFNLNWEFEDDRDDIDGKRLDSIRVELDDQFELIGRQRLSPLNTVPHAAAALWLGAQVARELV
ncbi:hypothetical protein [Micromonospora sp. NBRC 110037]|uniref:hypothetical protein n=1 Tax=Micromonospora sp. NBRC 110037 TaxID=1621261 RepID=UPI000A482AB2|nr:hypothetical protein [Micromonospora sp. NBRC 110037]